ncbi:hypothetical protein Dimus_034349 [Dionaea muscipula]
MEKTRKPGQRQFECVKRAWHSDRHRPMRGSIIQQIFRVVNEAHSSATRKNREWQEKHPIVVLKAEEIMYSKANSEAEYMNQDTLWDRLNDAIDTIIRRDESTETGQLLQPCIEAALVLGCIPVRASRSQRLHPNVLPGIVSSAPFESTTSMKFGSVYPLYYHGAAHFRPLEPQICFPLRQNSNSNSNSNSHSNSNLNNVFIGTPVGWPPTATEMAHLGTTRNLFPGDDRVNASEIDCDLSLRLGPSSGTRCLLAREIGDGGASSCNEGNKFLQSSSPRNREFCFFPQRNANDPSESCCPGKVATEGEVRDIAALRKRKAPIDDDLCTRWQPDPRSNQFPPGGIRWRGS